VSCCGLASAIDTFGRRAAFASQTGLSQEPPQKPLFNHGLDLHNTSHCDISLRRTLLRHMLIFPTFQGAPESATPADRSRDRKQRRSLLFVTCATALMRLPLTLMLASTGAAGRS